MEYVPNKLYKAKISEIKEYEGNIDFKEYENQTKDGSRKFKSYLCRIKLDKFGDQWFSGFFNESKKTPGTPGIWKNMELDFTITERSVEKDGVVNVYYNIKKISQKEAKDLEIEALKQQLAQAQAPTPVVAQPTPVVEQMEEAGEDLFADLVIEPDF